MLYRCIRKGGEKIIIYRKVVLINPLTKPAEG